MQPSPTPTPKISATSHNAFEDDHIRVSSLEKTYSLADTIRFKVAIITEFVYFHGPCDTWFERKAGQTWEEVGYCPESNFTDEPYSLGAGEEIEITLPMSSVSDTHYSYDLTPGTYRYAITYWTQDGDHLIYSPEFNIMEQE